MSLACVASPVFSIGLLREVDFLSNETADVFKKFYSFFLWSTLKRNFKVVGGTKAIDLYFQECLLIYRPTTYDLFVIICPFERPEASGCANVALSWHKSRLGKRKLSRSQAPTVQFLQLQDPHQ